MEYKELSNGFRIPVVGIGTWGMGGLRQKDTTNDRQDTAAIRAAINLGYTHIDTAEMYGNGHTEELVGEAVKDFDRKKLFLTSKVLSQHLGYEDLILAAKRSIQKLQTRYLDLYLIHAFNPKIPIKETMEALDHLIDKGFVRFIGVSNFSVEQMKTAQKHTSNRIVANELQYNIICRNRGRYTENIEKEIIPYCQENDIIVIAWEPLAHGALAKPGFALLDELRVKYGKTQAQIAINWLISKKGVVTIAKSSKLEHLKENLGAIGWKMSEEDTQRLDSYRQNLE
jgi:diketogulonate reductase-like aldo/keto reductase